MIVVKNSKFRKISFLKDHLEIIESIFSSKVDVPYSNVSSIEFEKYFYSQYVDDCMTIAYTQDGKKKKIVIEVTEKDFLKIAELIADRKILIVKKSNY